MRKDFFGHKKTKIHENRINIPKEFKCKFTEGEELIITIGPNKRIAIFTNDNFIETIEKLKLGDRRQKILSRRLRRFAMSAQTLEGPGRVRIDSDLLEFSKITKEVMVEGNGNFMTIWDSTAYDEYKSEQFKLHLEEIEEEDYDI
ncbi:MAG: hypothetical protein U9N34_03375 [Candidatus Cloacimonadota bacterium]|nr:hypothetical protein [Candidatus Cloacimonadota bacterium]